MKNLWIAGGGGAALEVWAVALALEQAGAAERDLRGFLVVGEPSFDPEGLQVREEARFLAEADPDRDEVVLALGAPALRAAAAERYTAAGLAFATLVHPSAVVGPRVELGTGTVVMALAVLETHVRVGAHGLVNVHASIAHEGRLGDCVSLGPGVRLAGRCSIGDRCDLGAGAILRPGITLGPDAVLGAGAVLVRDHPGNATLAGVPARALGR